MHHTNDKKDQTEVTLNERAEEILCDALEIECESERMTFVSNSCAGDPDLTILVEHMLQAQDDSIRLFNALSPTSFTVTEIAEAVIDECEDAGDASFALPDDDEVGKQIGNYTLLKRIGEGGAGSVYLAEQTKPLRRQVALKIIKLGMDTKSVIARFEAERQALAMMEHPNIAHVLNAGCTDTGRPFFVMELVNGTPITIHCENIGMDIPRRLKLFIQICQAIHHAHQKGIIHRDIKPSNILVTKVDGITAPKIIDFGIAKAAGGQMLSDETSFTSHNLLIGTPAYMSPEQADLAALDIDVRCDIYSLGVLLYELLTGKTPFDQKKLVRSGLDEMRRTIREREPPRPSDMLAVMHPEELTRTAESRRTSPHKLISQLKGDLDWIAMKALEKDRERRYGSAEAMADDIRRHLEHEPVVACPPSRMYRLRKLVRRNKVTFAAGGIVLIILIISTGVSTWLLFEQQSARQYAQRAETEKVTIQKEAETLRLHVESHKKADKALVLFRREQFEQADAVLENVELVPISPGNARMFRGLGDWHALNGRWIRAKDRFDVLMKINELEGLDSTMDDQRYASLLVEQGCWAEYDAFRESLIWRYAETKSPIIAQRVLRACLLHPPHDELMHTLAHYASITEQSYKHAPTDESIKLWEAYALVLWLYRQKDYEACVRLCELTDPDPYTKYISVRNISIRLIQAAALYQLEKTETAETFLDHARSCIKTVEKADPSDPNVWMGNWFNSAYMRIHLREAETLIAPAVDDQD